MVKSHHREIDMHVAAIIGNALHSPMYEIAILDLH